MMWLSFTWNITPYRWPIIDRETRAYICDTQENNFTSYEL